MNCFAFILCIFALYHLTGGDLQDTNKLKIVFVYTVVPAVCPQGLPGMSYNLAIDFLIHACSLIYLF